MNVQLYAYEGSTRYELDLYQEEPIKINLSAESITDPQKIESDFTRQFRIPATNNNSRFFEYWYIAGVLDFDITKKVIAELHVDGILYRTGQLRLLATYANEASNKIDFEVVFFGETKDFSSQLGELFMNQLDLVDSAHVLTVDALEDSWLPLTDPDVLVGGKVRYFIGDRGYEFDEQGVQQPVPNQTNASEVAIDNSACTPCNESHNNAFTKSNHPLHTTQFIPIVQVKYLIDKMFDQTTYTYSDDSFFSDTSTYWPMVQDLYTDGIGVGLPFTPNSDARINVQKFSLQPVEEFQPIPFDVINLNNSGGFNIQTYKYTAPADGNYTFDYYLQGVVSNDNDPGQPEPVANMVLAKNGSAIDNAVYPKTQTGTQGQLFYQFTSPGETYTLVAGDEIFIYMYFANEDYPPSLSTGTFEVTQTPSQIAVNDMMKPDVKQIDFFKSILTKFRLIMVPSKDKDNEFIIKPWVDYMGYGDTFDWTKKLDYSKDVVMAPVFFDQTADIKFTDQDDIDQTNTYHQNTFSLVYGTRLFESKNELLSDSKEITTELAPTPATSIEGSPPGTNFIVSNFFENGDTVSDHNHIQHVPIIPKPRLLFWNGLRPTSDQSNNNSITFYYSDGTTTKDSGQAPLLSGAEKRYPCASYLSEIPSTATTLNLGWNIAFAYFALDGGPVGNTGESVYDRYWKTYIGNLYSPQARMMTAYFQLSNEDLRNLTFDDIIYIKDSYWRVQRVYDAPLGEQSLVRVSLIKLLDYIAP